MRACGVMPGRAPLHCKKQRMQGSRARAVTSRMSYTSFALGRAVGSSTEQLAMMAATSAGHSSGTLGVYVRA